MKLLRLILNQNKAAYAVEEMAQNIGTYPLPQLSTVIGMLCAAHKELDLSGIKLGVQGRYRSKRTEMHMRKVHLDIADDNRGTLVYYPNPDIFEGSIWVAKALTKQDSSFEKRQNVQVFNNDLLALYSTLRGQKRASAGLSKEEKAALKREQSHFQTLLRVPTRQDVLYDVELVIHALIKEKDAKVIIENQNELVRLGRAEDFIDLKEIRLVETEPNLHQGVASLARDYQMYVNADRSDGRGTVYYLSKRYTIEKNKRVFERVPCLLTSKVPLSGQMRVDEDGYLVDLN